MNVISHYLMVGVSWRSNSEYDGILPVTFPKTSCGFDSYWNHNIALVANRCRQLTFNQWGQVRLLAGAQSLQV
jgi:hypothetical protein